MAVVLFYDLWVAAELQNHHAALIVKGLLPACSEVKASHCLCKESLSVGNPKENNSLLPAALTFPLVFTPTFNRASSQDCNNSHSAWRQHHNNHHCSLTAALFHCIAAVGSHWKLSLIGLGCYSLETVEEIFIKCIPQSQTVICKILKII